MTKEWVARLIDRWIPEREEPALFPSEPLFHTPERVAIVVEPSVTIGTLRQALEGMPWLRFSLVVRGRDELGIHPVRLHSLDPDLDDTWSTSLLLDASGARLGNGAGWAERVQPTAASLSGVLARPVFLPSRMQEYADGRAIAVAGDDQPVGELGWILDGAAAAGVTDVILAGPGVGDDWIPVPDELPPAGAFHRAVVVDGGARGNGAVEAQLARKGPRLANAVEKEQLVYPLMSGFSMVELDVDPLGHVTSVVFSAGLRRAVEANVGDALRSMELGPGPAADVRLRFEILPPEWKLKDRRRQP